MQTFVWETSGGTSKGVEGEKADKKGGIEKY